MEFREVVARRRMVRNYSDEPVDSVVVDRMLRHAVRAPSAGFSQGWAFLRLDSGADIARFWASSSPDPSASNRWLDGMRRAPVIIVPMSNKQAYLDRYAERDKGWTDRDESRWPVPYWHIDAGMATLLVLQTATDEGLGACFFGIPPTQTDAFRSEFGVPEEYAPLGAITVGHFPEAAAPPSSPGSPATRQRRPLSDVVHRGQWSH